MKVLKRGGGLSGSYKKRAYLESKIATIHNKRKGYMHEKNYLLKKSDRLRSS